MYCVHLPKIKDEKKHIEFYPFTCRVFICLYILKYIGCLVNFDQFQMCHFPVLSFVYGEMNIFIVSLAILLFEVSCTPFLTYPYKFLSGNYTQL